MKIRINMPELKLCPLKTICMRYTFPILKIIHDFGTVRYSQIRKELNGVQSKTLSDNLKLLINSLIIEKKIRNHMPPHVEYNLTGNGLELMSHLTSLSYWSNKRLRKI
jgi:DNA-binding HxlR family transcriptional regulator